MGYWWVNHNKTFTQEIEGAYLWSPKRESNNSRSQFYENMRLASPNDVVFSFGRSTISYVGIVSEYAISAPKPTEFGAIGTNWGPEGWLLPVGWWPMPSPVRPKTLIPKLGALLPTKYSPIDPATGNGHQKAYLTEISQAVFSTIMRSGDPLGTWSNREEFRTEADPSMIGDRVDDTIEEAIIADDSLSATEKKQLVDARRGQGRFRMNLRRIERRCRVTGLENQTLLIASHIKPWRSCASSSERLDGSNGLLLAAHVDRLFDRGLITFSADGKIIVSPRAKRDDLHNLGLSEALNRDVGAFTPLQQKYLEYHRAEVFLEEDA
jgi:putative restriction endonuclease